MTEYTSLAIALTATTFMSAPAIAVSLTPTLGENSVFSYSEGSENDYNFTLQEADAEGNLTTKYYKINLKPEAFSTSPRISWSEVGEDQKDAENVVEVKLPNNQNKYFQYTYTPEEGRTVYNTRQNNTLSGDVNADFVESSYASNGGAIYNESATIGNITGDFIDNSTSGYSNSGGAIYNYNGKIGDITGDFINNFATGEGSAIFNSKGTIGDITGNFINNYTSGGSAGSWYGVLLLIMVILIISPATLLATPLTTAIRIMVALFTIKDLFTTLSVISSEIFLTTPMKVMALLLPMTALLTILPEILLKTMEAVIVTAEVPEALLPMPASSVILPGILSKIFLHLMNLTHLMTVATAALFLIPALSATLPGILLKIMPAP